MSLGLQPGVLPGRQTGRRQRANGRSYAGEGASWRIRPVRAQAESEGEASAPAPASKAAAAAEPKVEPAPKASSTPSVGDSLKVRWTVEAACFRCLRHQAWNAADGA